MLKCHLGPRAERALPLAPPSRRAGSAGVRNAVHQRKRWNQTPDNGHDALARFNLKGNNADVCVGEDALAFVHNGYDVVAMLA